MWLALSFGLLPFDRLTHIAYGDILTVHGVFSLNQGLPGQIAPYSPYALDLANNVESYLKSKKIRGTVLPFVWGGETRDSQDAVSGDNGGSLNLKETIKLAYRASQAKSEPFTIVAHSWGGVLVYKALRELAREGTQVSVDNFITMGTPLGYVPRLTQFGDCLPMRISDPLVPDLFDLIAPREASKRELCEHASELVGQQINNLGGIIKNWVNYHSPNDPISQPIASGAVLNRNLQTDLGLPSIGGLSQDHSQYFDVGYRGIASRAVAFFPDVSFARAAVTAVPVVGLPLSWGLQMPFTQAAVQAVGQAVARRVTADETKVRENAKAVLSEVSKVLVLTDILKRPPTAAEINKYSNIEVAGLMAVSAGFSSILNRPPTESELYRYADLLQRGQLTDASLMLMLREQQVTQGPDEQGAIAKEKKCPERQQTETAGSSTFEQWKKWKDEVVGKSRMPGC